jgi:integrase
MARDLIPSDTTIRNLKPSESRKRLTDGDGLYLLLFVKGGAHGWRLDYTIHGKRKTLSLGTYPDTGLKLAREKANDARRLVAAGTDPSDVRKAKKTEQARSLEDLRLAEAGLPGRGSFEEVARDWFEQRNSEWAPSYGQKIMRRLEVDVFPYIGRLPIGAIAPPQLLEVLKRIEQRGVIETAHRALENCSQVFRYGVVTGQITSDPSRDLKDALRRPHTKHFAAITDPRRLGELLRACDGYKGTHVVRTALLLAPMVLLRPGEMRQATWEEFDLENAVWTVPSARMKRERAGKLHGKPHVVPLATQAVQALRALHPLTGGSPFVFRGERHHFRPMSDAAINAALRAMGFSAQEVTGHGFRATARTMLVERLGVDEAVVEAQLAHSVKDSLGRAYNRTEFLEQRKSMMQQWADYLDELRKATPQI